MSFAVPDEFRGRTVEDLARMLAVGGVHLEDIETLKRLCELGRHARFLRLESEGRLPLVHRGRLMDMDA
jgi:hypothetical protein